MKQIKEFGGPRSMRTNFYDSMLCGPKILYFFSFLQQYSFYGFRSVFLTEHFKFNTRQTGIIFSMSALCSFIGMTAWSNLADSTKRPKTVYISLIIGAVLTFMALIFEESIRQVCPVIFYVVLPVICVYSFFNFGMNPILSNTVLEMLTAAGETDKSVYGRQVLFGSIAYIVSNFVQGWANDSYGVRAVFVILPVSSVMLLFAVLFAFPKDANKEVSGEKEKTETFETKLPSALPWWHVLRSTRFVLFLTVIFLTGCARSVMSAFLPLFYKNDLKLTSTESSWLMISGVTLEMLSFSMSPIVSMVGPYWMLVLAQIIMTIRACAYVYIPADRSYLLVFMFIELLKGAAFGLTHLAGVRIARETAPEGLEATAQGFYEGFYSQIPSILSVTLGGIALDSFGFSALFKFTAWGIAFSCALVTVVFIQSGKLKFSKLN